MGSVLLRLVAVRVVDQVLTTLDSDLANADFAAGIIGAWAARYAMDAADSEADPITAARPSLAFNVLSALTFVVGGFVAYLLSGSIDVAVLIPFAADNIVYIAAADLISQFSGEESAAGKLLFNLSPFVGLGTLYLLAGIV